MNYNAFAHPVPCWRDSWGAWCYICDFEETTPCVKSCTKQLDESYVLSKLRISALGITILFSRRTANLIALKQPWWTVMYSICVEISMSAGYGVNVGLCFRSVEPNDNDMEPNWRQRAGALCGRQSQNWLWWRVGLSSMSSPVPRHGVKRFFFVSVSTVGNYGTGHLLPLVALVKGWTKVAWILARGDFSCDHWRFDDSRTLSSTPLFQCTEWRGAQL